MIPLGGVANACLPIFLLTIIFEFHIIVTSLLKVQDVLHLKNKSFVEGELVLIHIEDNPAFYGRVEAISPDIKPKWWQVKFLFLTVPCQFTTWILDEEQIRGADFTMGGTPIRVEKVTMPEDETFSEEEGELDSSDPEKPVKKKATVLSLHKKE